LPRRTNNERLAVGLSTVGAVELECLPVLIRARENRQRPSLAAMHQARALVLAAAITSERRTAVSGPGMSNLAVQNA
jgi:hypothetical protein